MRGTHTAHAMHAANHRVTCLLETKMADQILTRFTPELVAAIGGNIRDISDRFLARQLISNEVHEQVLESTATSADQARTLLEAIKDAVAIDQTIFEIMMEVLREVAFSADKERPVPPFMHEMKKQYLLKSRNRKHRRTYSDPTVIDQELAAHLKASKLITDTKPETIFIPSRVIIIEMFTKELISAMSTSIETVCDECLAKGLIRGETYRKLHETTSNSKKDKAKILLQEMKETIENDDRCFDLFLTTLNRNLPTPIGSKVVAEITKESENYTLAPADSPCHQASDNSGDVDAKHQLEVATTKLAEACHEKEGLEKELAAKVKEIEGLKEERFNAKRREKDNTEKIKQLEKDIGKHEDEIWCLKKKVSEKEKKVEFCREKEGLEEELAGKVKEIKGLKEELFNAKKREKDNTEKIEQLEKDIGKHKEEISCLKKKVSEKEKEVEFWDMTMKRERELFQQERSQKDDLLSKKDDLLSQLTKVTEVEARICESLKAHNQNLEQDNMKLQKEKDEFMETNIELEQKNSDLLQKNGSLQSEVDSLKSLKADLEARNQGLEQNVKKLQKEKDEFSRIEREKSQRIGLLQSELDRLKLEHRNCIIRSRDNPCFCDSVGREYCPKKHGPWESCSIS